MAEASRGPRAASRNAEVSLVGGLLSPSRAAAASSGGGRRCAARGRGRQARAAGPPPPPSPAPRPGGGVRPCRAARGRAVRGGARPCAGPEPAYPARRVAAARCPVARRREALARPARVTHAYTRTGDTARRRAAHAQGRRWRGGGGPRPANRARRAALVRMPGAGRAALLSRDLASPIAPPPVSLPHDRVGMGGGGSLANSRLSR